MVFLLGCDLGTTATKTGLFDEGGNLLALARESSNILYGEDGSVTQNPEEMLLSVVRTVKEVAEKSGVNPQDIAAIALDGQMAGIMGVDKEGEAATPYDSWLDVRSASYAQLMKEKAEELIIKRSGMGPSINHGPKILWWKNEHPEVYQRIVKFTVPSCWIAQKLAGLSGEETYIDYTYIHFSCFANLKRNIWDEEILDLFGVTKEKMSRIVVPWEIIGNLKREWADQMGLPSGIPIVAGCGDTAANNLGAGVVRRGIAFDVAGAASCFSLFVDRFTPDVKFKTLLFPRSVLKGYYYPMAYINGGGMDVEWAKSELFRELSSSPDAFPLINQEVEKYASPPSGIIFIPHLRGRNCPAQPYLRGVFSGFSWDHKREHLFLAILEGIAFEYAFYLKVLRKLIPDVDFFEVRVIGGGAQSPLWNRIKASILGVPYVTLNRKECAIWGSAMLAGFAAGVFPDLAEKALASVDKVAVFEPDEKLHRQYEDILPLYLETMEKIGGVMTKFKSLSAKGRG